MTFVALLRKDWRVHRTAIAGGAILVALPYVILLGLQWIFPSPSIDTREALVNATLAAAHVGLILTMMMSAVFGGSAFAGERRERSAEFLAMLPVSRWRIALSKLLVSAVCLGAMWGVHGVMVTLAGNHGAARDGGAAWAQPASEAMGGIYVAFLATCFAVAWLFSSFMHNASLATLYALAVGALAFIGLTLLLQVVPQTYGPEHVGLPVYLYERRLAYASTLGLAALAFAIGSLIHVRRISR